MAHTISHGTNTWQSEGNGNDNSTRVIITRNYARFSMPKRQIPFLSSVLRGDIQNYCKFELQSPDNMTIVNKLLYIGSYYLAFMVIFSNVLKSSFETTFWQKIVSKQLFTTDH